MEGHGATLFPLLFESIMALAMLAAIIGLITGIWLLVAPNSFNVIEQKSGRTFSLRRTLRPLELVRNIDRHIYRNHQIVGLAIIAASVFTLYRVLFDVTDGRAATLLNDLFTPALGEWLYSSLELLLITTHLFTIVIGLVIYVRPSALKGLEARANHWITAREHTRWLDTQYNLPDRLLQSYPRQLGFLLLLLSIYLISLLTII